MGTRLLAGVVVLTIAVMSLVAPGAAQSGSGGTGASGGDAAAKKYYGTWSGKWEGEGQTGGFDVVLEDGKDGKPGGHVSVSGEPTYKATLKTVAFDGAKMTASYDFPPDPSVTVNLAATFEGAAATGTWSLKSPTIGDIAGTWAVTKKK